MAFYFLTKGGVKLGTGFRAWLISFLCFCLHSLQWRGCCLLCDLKPVACLFTATQDS